MGTSVVEVTSIFVPPIPIVLTRCKTGSVSPGAAYATTVSVLIPVPAKLRLGIVPEFNDIPPASAILSKVISSVVENFDRTVSYNTVSALKSLTNPEPPAA